MRKNIMQIKAMPVVGILSVSAMLAGLAYAATAFVNSTPPVIGHVAQPVLSNFNLQTGAESIYRGEYEKGNWSGNLSCYSVSSIGVVDTTLPCWSSGTGATLKVGAQSKVDAQGFASGSRNIATLDATGTAVPFTLAAGTVADLVDAAHVNYIRGDRSQEAGATPPGTLRTRLSALGDNVHSRPYYFADATNPTVFYGGNDGMLHAIDATQATGGKERWAYIPSMLIPKLKGLWAASYAHDYFVDGNINVSNVGTAASPQNILVGTLGAGGKGIYALDVTSLTAATDADVVSKFLWEITPTSLTTKTGRSAVTTYKNLGDSYSNATVYPVETGNSAVMVGNGYNNTGSGTATLFVIDTKTGALIREIDTGSGSVTSPNGLSTPVAVDSNSNGKADIVYAGDIDGNMWKFDMTSSNPASWTSSLLYATKSNPATPAGQAITMMPGVALHPAGGYMVNFATGRIFTAADQADTATHYAYGIWDGAPTTNTTLVTQQIQQRTYLPVAGATPVTVRVAGVTPEGVTVAPNWNAGGNKGWMTKLPVAGERVTGDSAYVQYGRFFFNATNPTIKFTPTGWPANSGAGENWLMELNYLTGGAPTQAFFDMNGDGILNTLDRIQYVAGDTITAPKKVGDSIDTNFGVPIGLFTTNGVQSQPVLGGVGALSALFYNQNFDGTPASSTVVQNPGSTGINNGHFDVDNWYHTTNNSAANATRSSTVGVKADYAFIRHEHEYDKTWNVNGVNLLNPSGDQKTNPVTVPGKFWLGNAVNATIPYKVLVFNQGWNRAAEIQVGSTASSAWISTKDYQTQAGLTMASLVTYSGNTEDVTTTTLPAPGTVATKAGTGGVLLPLSLKINSLQIRMPYNAFAPLDWWKDGVKMNGLIPTTPTCIMSINTGNGTQNGNPGPNGERNDGALSIQIVRADTPDSAVQLNVTTPVTIAGKVYPPETFGYRVKDASINKYVMYEEVVYWHHPSDICFGDTTSTGGGTKIVPAVAATAEKCSSGTVVPADPATCTALTADFKDKNGNVLFTKGTSIVTPASCTGGGTYTPAQPAYPAFPAVASYTGWTFLAPPDSSPNSIVPVPRKCGTNDPHDANFVPGLSSIGGGTNAGSTTTSSNPVVIPSGLLGGTPVGVVIPPSKCVAGTTGCTCVGTSCTTAGSGSSTCGGAGQAACVSTCGGAGQPACVASGKVVTQITSKVKTGRLSWHELISQ